MSERRTRLPDDLLTDAALTAHLVRAARGEGRWYPQSDGDRKFACAIPTGSDGCPWCDHLN